MAQLINITDGYHLWSERFDRTMEDVFDIQDEISEAIADALKLRLVDEATTPKVNRYTDDLDAYHLYLQGRHQWFTRPQGWRRRALRWFEQAIDKDPSYPLAHAGTAQVHVISGTYGFLPPKAAFSQARAAVDRALRYVGQHEKMIGRDLIVTSSPSRRFATFGIGSGLTCAKRAASAAAAHGHTGSPSAPSGC